MGHSKNRPCGSRWVCKLGSGAASIESFLPFRSLSLLRQIPNNTAHLWWDHTWGGMLNSLDKGIGNVTAALRAENMWDSTVLLLTADNGGDCGFSAFLEPAVENNLANRARANNYPLRGRKCTPW